MTYQELSALLATVPLTGAPVDPPKSVPFAFHHWEAVPPPPYGVYFDRGTSNFAADNMAYAVIKDFTVELYLSQRDEAQEGAMEAVLDGASLYWDKTATYVAELRQYQISYEIEV